MGAECPNGHGRQNIVHNITADGKASPHANDVLAQRLACGCVIGGEEYRNFLDAVHKIDLESNLAVERIKKGAQDKKAAVYKGMMKSREA